MKKKKTKQNSWTFEVKVITEYIIILVVGVLLAGILGGDGFWEQELQKMGSQIIPLFAWMVLTPIGLILLRRHVFYWSKSAKQFDKEKAEHKQRMKDYNAC